jgi:hypothetical protein
LAHVRKFTALLLESPGGNKLPGSHRPRRNRIIDVIDVEALRLTAYW